MEAEGDSGESMGEQPQLLPGPGITDPRGTKNPRRDQALLRELRKEEKELKDEERQLVKEREQQMEPTDMPEEHQRLHLSSPDCSSLKQSRKLLDRIERNAQRQLAVANEIRRLSQQTRTVKARNISDIQGEHAANGGDRDNNQMELDISSMERSRWLLDNIFIGVYRLGGDEGTGVGKPRAGNRGPDNVRDQQDRARGHDTSDRPRPNHDAGDQRVHAGAHDYSG